MVDLEKQPSLPTCKSSVDPTVLDASPRHSASHSHSPEPPILSMSDPYAGNKLKAWMAVFGSFLSLFCSFGQMTAFGTFQSWYLDHQLSSMSSFSISWIGSLQLWTFFFMGGPIGWLFDAYGPSPLLIIGTIILSLSTVLTSVVTEYYQYLLAQGVLFGLGVAMLFYPSLASVATHFNEYRATAIGIASAGSGCGGVVYPIALRYLFNSIGFEWGVRASALVSAVLGITATLTIKTRFPVKKAGVIVDVRLIRDTRFLLLVAGSSFVCLGSFIPYFYISEYAEKMYMPPNTAFLVLSIMNGGSIVGRIAPAWLSDKIGRFNLLCPTAFLSGLSCLVIWMFAKHFIAIAIFSAIYGFLSGAFYSVITPCIAQISDMREMGTRIGALYTLISIPSLCGGPIAGELLQRQQGSFTAAIALAGSSIVLGSVFLLASKLKIEPNFFCHV